MCCRWLFLVPALLLCACSDSTTEPGTGTLVVSIHPPPPGVAPVVTVTGTHGYQHVLTSSTTLPALPAGAYTVVTTHVLADGVRFEGTPTTQTVAVPAGSTASTLEITYAAATSRLTVSVAGLPVGTRGNVVVTGPLGFHRAITETTQLDFLEPGEYTMTAADVEAGSTIYHPTPTTLRVPLVPTVTMATAFFTYR